MGVDYVTAFRRLADIDPDTTLQSVAPWPTNRPMKYQPPVVTDGLDPAASGGPAPMNSGPTFDEMHNSVASDPLMENPVRPGGAVPWQSGPDMDQSTLTRP